MTKKLFFEDRALSGVPMALLVVLLLLLPALGMADTLELANGKKMRAILSIVPTEWFGLKWTEL